MRCLTEALSIFPFSTKTKVLHWQIFCKVIKHHFYDKKGQTLRCHSSMYRELGGNYWIKHVLLCTKKKPMKPYIWDKSTKIKQGIKYNLDTNLYFTWLSIFPPAQKMTNKSIKILQSSVHFFNQFSRRKTRS